MSKMINMVSAEVVDSGSNANGEWIKFADGTLICFNSDPKTGLAPTAYTVQGLSIYRIFWTWTFPKAFIDVPSVSGSPRFYSGGAGLVGTLGSLYPAGTTTVDTKIVAESLLDFDAVQEPALVAIGRWK